jgi:hypothetical protein
MRSLIVVGSLIAVVAVVGCGSENSGTSHITAPPIATAAPTVAPTPTPPPTLVGIWQIQNQVPRSHWLSGYGIEISSFNPATGEVRGRSFYDVRDFTGPLRGTYRASDRHLDWQTLYTITDTENGSATLDLALRRMDGQVVFELNTFSVKFGFTGLVMQRTSN